MEKKLLELDEQKYTHFAYHALQLGFMSAQTANKEFFIPEMVLLTIISQKRFVKAIQPLDSDIAFTIIKLNHFIDEQDCLSKDDNSGVEYSKNMADLFKRIKKEFFGKGVNDGYCDVRDLIRFMYDQQDSYARFTIENICNGDIEGLLNLLEEPYNINNDCLECNTTPGMYDDDMFFDMDKDMVEMAKKGIQKHLGNIAKTLGINLDDIPESSEKAKEQEFESVGEDVKEEKEDKGETNSLPLPFPVPKEVAELVKKQLGKAKNDKNGKKDDGKPSLQGISITFGVGTNKMMEELASAMGGRRPIPVQDDEDDDDDDQPTKGRQPQREQWEYMVTCISDTYKKKNPLIGREKELERTIQVLCRKDKNNPLHLGEPGVGKTALIYGLARKIEEYDVPFSLFGKKIYMLDMGTLVAGASYHGEFERRIKEIMEGCKRRGNCIIYIDEIHTMMGAGATNGSSLDASNMLKQYLEDGSIRFIGSTTYQEYNRHMANNKSIVRRFQTIDIQEPSTDEAVQIVEGLIKNYEKYHGVKYEPSAIRYAVEQSARLIADRFLPDKAIDIIDEAGAYRQTHPLYNKKGEIMSAGRQRIDKKVIDEILAKVCKISAKALVEEDNSSLKDLAERITGEIYGQDEAVQQVVRAVKLSKAGLTIGDKPLASLLFVGPTGVGKTEVCKVLAQQLGIELVRFDMSEYTEKHTVAKLIGSPAGYVGYDDGGLLTDAIRKNPNCVLLLDEIEKAHADIYNILLQVMDYAKLTDNKGNKVDFKNVILVMTSNAGAQYAGQASLGFSGGQTKGEAMLQTVKKTFKPEFLNRLTGTVVFHDMDKHMATLILDKKLRQLSDLLAKKNVTISLSPEAHEFLLNKGFTTQYGAREIDRVIQNLLTPILMDEILFGKLAKGGNAKVTLNGETLKLEKLKD